MLSMSAVVLLMTVPSYALTKTRPDIVVPNLNDNKISIVVNAVGREFVRLPADLPAGNAPVFVASGDFNEDRLRDLAIVNVNGQLTFMLGAGNGTFTPVPIPFELNYLLSDSLAVGDFNNDGHDDILVSSQGSSVQILLGDGKLADNANNHFTAQSPAFVANRANAVAVADFNKDGKLDGVVCDYSGSSVAILKGDGNGGLTSSLSLSTGETPSEVAVGDFNADGNADFAVAGGTSQYVSVYLGNGNGTFAPEIQVATRTGSDGTFTVAVGDFNNDGYDDLATRGGNSNPGEDLLVVRLWDPAQNNFLPAGSVPAQGAWLAGLTVADFDGDGKQDVVFTNAPVDNTISIYYGDGAGNLGSRKDIAVGNLPNSIAVVDVDPVVRDYTTTVRFSNKADGQGDMSRFSTNETLFVLLNDEKLTKNSIPDPIQNFVRLTQIRKNKFGQDQVFLSKEASFIARQDGTFVAAISLDGFGLGDIFVNTRLKASFGVDSVWDDIDYHRRSKISIHRVVISFEQFAAGTGLTGDKKFPDFSFDFFSDRKTKPFTAQTGLSGTIGQIAVGNVPSSLAGSDIVGVLFNRPDIDHSNFSVIFKTIYDSATNKTSLMFDQIIYHIKEGGNPNVVPDSVRFGHFVPALGGGAAAVPFGPSWDSDQ